MPQASSVAERVPPPEVMWSLWAGGTRHDAADLESALSAAELGQGFVWVGLHNPTERTLTTLGEVLKIHELVIADAVHGHRRSKLERFDENLFLVASTVSYVEREEQQTVAEIVSTGELMIILGPHWVVTSRQRGKSRRTPRNSSLTRREAWRLTGRTRSNELIEFRRCVSPLRAP